MSENQNNKPFSMIADIDGDFMDILNIETPNEVPILAVRNCSQVSCLQSSLEERQA